MTEKPMQNTETGADVELTARPSPAPDQQSRDQRPDPRLTLPPKALAGSPACLNCATPLSGPYCYYCGQPDRNFMRFFPALLREVLSESLEFDSRFMRTMVPLLFRPGRLTRDYLTGRRFRYTPPLRLYLFSSIIFFLLAAFLSSDAIELSSGDERQNAGIQITAGTEEELARLEEALAGLPPGLREQIPLDTENAVVQNRANTDFFETEEIIFNNKPWHPVDNPIAVSWWPDWLNERANEEMGNSPEKAKRISEDPRLLMNEIFDILPAAMFVLLPVVALILKFWYLFSGRYYIEHLILALHNHSFVFVMMVFFLLLDSLASFAGNRNLGWLAQGSHGLTYLTLAWVPFYLVGSLRTVYRQNWFMTISKGFLIAFSYVMLLVFVSTMVGLLSFILV